MEQTHLLSILILIGLPVVVHSSWGDRTNHFQSCLYKCTGGCELQRYPGILPFPLRLFGWTCEDECKYTCMHKVTAHDVRMNNEIKQFYGKGLLLGSMIMFLVGDGFGCIEGQDTLTVHSESHQFSFVKWPFVRLLGIQEPASVIFSILNGLGHIFGWHRYKSCVPPSYRMYPIWQGLFLVSVNAWLWSSVFHSRDLLWTERLDYFCATSLALYSVFAFFVRVFGGGHWQWRTWLFAFIAMTLFCCHVAYLSLWKFDYGYNIKANVAVGIVNISGWLLWCIKNRREQPYVWKCALTTVSVFLLMGLEVGDFPPILWTFDAHSLWHLGTAPFCYFWYSFLIDDAKYELQEEDKNKKKD